MLNLDLIQFGDGHIHLHNWLWNLSSANKSRDIVRPVSEVFLPSRCSSLDCHQILLKLWRTLRIVFASLPCFVSWRVDLTETVSKVCFFWGGGQGVLRILGWGKQTNIFALVFVRVYTTVSFLFLWLLSDRICCYLEKNFLLTKRYKNF